MHAERLYLCPHLHLVNSYDYEDVYTEGITKITSADFAYAKVLGSHIKLFGTSKKKEDGSISAMVCPVMITNEHPLFAVNDVMNAILVRGECMGDLMFYGAGAEASNSFRCSGRC